VRRVNRRVESPGQRLDPGAVQLRSRFQILTLRGRSRPSPRSVTLEVHSAGRKRRSRIRDPERRKRRFDKRFARGGATRTCRWRAEWNPVSARCHTGRSGRDSCGPGFHLARSRRASRRERPAPSAQGLGLELQAPGQAEDQLRRIGRTACARGWRLDSENTPRRLLEPLGRRARRTWGR
jgi:hypothetical protein